MAMDTEAAFAVIQRALEAFNADIGKARTQQAQSEETIASVEYELDQLRKLIAENALPSDRTPPQCRQMSRYLASTSEVGRKGASSEPPRARPQPALSTFPGNGGGAARRSPAE